MAATGFIFLSCLEDMARGNIDFDTDSFKGMLTTVTYTENKTGHTKRSDVTNEVTGAGYTAGGFAVAVAIAKDVANNRINLTVTQPTPLSSATIAARKLVVYKARGGAATADELVGFVDFGADITSTAGAWQLDPANSTVLRLNNTYIADSKISALAAASAALGAMELAANDAGTSKKLTVAQVSKYVGWRDLGEAVLGAGAARTSDIVWTGDYKILRIFYLIAGYAGNAIGRVILGSGALSETGTDCSCELIEGNTRTTTAVSICGWPTAVSLNTNRRWGEFIVNNVTGASVRDGWGEGMHGGSATVVPTGMSMSGFKASIAQIDRVRLTSFGAITGNTVGSNFNTGTYLRVQGIPA
jgi:hypothetical protein